MYAHHVVWLIHISLCGVAWIFGIAPQVPAIVLNRPVPLLTDTTSSEAPSVRYCTVCEFHSWWFGGCVYVATDTCHRDFTEPYVTPTLLNRGGLGHVSPAPSQNFDYLSFWIV